LAAKTRAAWQAAGTDSTMVISDNYGQAGAVNYFNSRVGLHALSFNADYNNWFPAPYQPANIIVIKESIASDDEMNPYRRSYASVRLMDSVTNPLARENGTRIYLASGLVDSIWPFFRRRIIASGF
ncbi:MAG: hypothetical protein ABIT96_02415, partial [Ferruginibacter sp.]